MRKNKYVIRSKIYETKFREILKYFAADLTPKQIANFTKININTINRILKLLRQKIAQHCEQQAKLDGDVETDESYFGPKRVKGKSGRGTTKKIPVVGLLKCGGKIFTKIVENCDRRNLHKFIQENVEQNSTIHFDGWRGYDGLVDIGYKKHYRVHHGKNEFVRGKSHINGIENFWGIAKVRLAKFRRIHKSNFSFQRSEV